MEQFRLWVSRSLNRVSVFGINEQGQPSSQDGSNDSYAIAYDYNLIEQLRNSQYQLLMIITHIRSKLKTKQSDAIKQASRAFLNHFNNHMVMEKNRLFPYLDSVLDKSSEDGELVKKYQDITLQLDKKVSQIVKRWMSLTCNNESLGLIEMDIERIEELLLRNFNSQHKRLYPLYQSAPLYLD